LIGDDMIIKSTKALKSFTLVDWMVLIRIEGLFLIQLLAF
jgi:hypothetical protein